MKTLSPVRQCLLLTLLVVGFFAPACKQSLKNIRATNAEKELGKCTLLNSIPKVNKTLSEKGIAQADGLVLLNSHRVKYDFLINGLPRYQPETGHVYVQNMDKTDTNFIFGLSQSFKKQLAFTSLKYRFGSWVDPLLNGPVIITTFQLNSNNKFILTWMAKNCCRQLITVYNKYL
jgi:hypothetical protein